jgi:type IV pilus assembly protein PilX
VNRHHRARQPAQGFSLIVAMLMLAVIGLASAAIMRNATSGDQVANNNRLQTQANQYAQLALRYCENQLALPAASRQVQVFGVANPPSWASHGNWGVKGSRVAHTLAATDIGSAVQPRVAPQCMMEATAAPSLYTVTSRGFSADFRADPGSGATTNGSSVWLQATILADGGADPGAAADSALTLRQRLWQQLLTPPF